MSLQIILIGLVVVAGCLGWCFRDTKPRLKGVLRAILGLALCGLATAVYDYLIHFACVMDPDGCSDPSISLYFRHLVQEEGIVYMIVMIIGFSLVGSGLRLRQAAR